MRIYFLARFASVREFYAYEEGLTEAWNSVWAYWKEPLEANREEIWMLAEPQTTVRQHAHGVPDKTQVSPDGCGLDNYYLTRWGAVDFRFGLFLDYASNVALYPVEDDDGRTRWD
jgi:hypothetical protein